MSVNEQIAVIVVFVLSLLFNVIFFELWRAQKFKNQILEKDVKSLKKILN